MTNAEVNQMNQEVIEQFYANGGRIVTGKFAGYELLLLTSTGAKSGAKRINPMMYYKDGGRYIVFASKKGGPTNPDWYHNLVANPEVTVDVAGQSFVARANVLAGQERQRVYDDAVRAYPVVCELQALTERQLPVIALERRDLQDVNQQVIEEFRANGGKVSSGNFVGYNLLLLTARGAKTGALRTTPLLYIKDGEDFIIFASRRGGPQHPDWYFNLIANPEVQVEVGSEKFKANAVVTAGAERQRIFENASREYPVVGHVQLKTSREIPLVALKRMD